MKVEPDHRHVLHFKSIVVVSVLIRVGLSEIVVTVDSRHDV